MNIVSPIGYKDIVLLRNWLFSKKKRYKDEETLVRRERRGAYRGLLLRI